MHAYPLTLASSGSSDGVGVRRENAAGERSKLFGRNFNDLAIPPLNHWQAEAQVFQHGIGKRLPHRPDRASGVFIRSID